jgi:hypothetical protein
MFNKASLSTTSIKKLHHGVLVLAGIFIGCSVALAESSEAWSFAARTAEQIKISYPAAKFDEDYSLDSPTIVIYLHPPRGIFSSDKVATRYPEILIEKVPSSSVISQLLADEWREISRGAISLHAIREYPRELTSYGNSKISDYGHAGITNGRLISVDRLKLKSTPGNEPKIPLQYRYKLEYQVAEKSSGQRFDVGEEVMLVRSFAEMTFQITYRDLLDRFKKEESLRETIFQNVELRAQDIDTRANATAAAPSGSFDYTQILLNIVGLSVCGVLIYNRREKQKKGLF